LQERAVYCDTDFAFFIQNAIKPPLIETGDNLVEITHELKPGEYIDEFVSGGPKNYTYRVLNRYASMPPKTVCKVRGITLNYAAMQVVNYEVLRSMIARGSRKA
jgi:hypothetical protein